jgi:hypothetical protein
LCVDIHSGHIRAYDPNGMGIPLVEVHIETDGAPRLEATPFRRIG